MQRSETERKMRNSKKNIITTLLSQLVITVCGVLIPRVMLRTYGSELYGLTTSVAQFLSYVALLEGGIGRVARGELYAPLAQNDCVGISRVYHAIKRFFMLVGLAFLGYTLILSVAYHDMAGVQQAGWWHTFLLVWIISTGTLAKYLWGLSNLTLLNADQKQYIGNYVVTGATIINALFVVVLAKSGLNILAVKIGSSLVYVAQPLCYWLYVKKHYKLPKVGKDRSKLKQKWTGIGQHIAYFVHTNIDVVILTLFANLQLVAVYSVYKLVISSVRKIVASFTSGMEAGFGELIAQKEQSRLQAAFRKYKHMLSFASVVLFGCTAVLIVPFVKLYTASVTDADYIQPAFAIVLLLSEAIDCFMHPCSSLPISANQLKQTKWGSYGEAAINVGLSLILVHWDPLLGIALATLLATVFKGIYYMIYAAKHILQIKIRELGFNFLLTSSMIALFSFLGHILIKEDTISNYGQWILWGFGVFAAISLFTSLVFFVCYPADQKQIFRTIASKTAHKKM